MGIENLKRPIVFIGSSTESLPIVEIIESGLESVATILPWNSDVLFAVGEFTLDSLIDIVPKVDFAILIFGKDDIVISRENKLSAPRDNVVFELGLFMSRLNRKRTFVVAPKNSRLKILSDISGLNLVAFDLPDGNVTLTRALKPALDRIKRAITKIGTRPSSIPIYLGPRDVLNVGQAVDELIFNALSKSSKVFVRNIALDMEVTWSMVRDRVLNNPMAHNITWHSLMVDAKSRAIKNMESETVSLRTALDKQKEIIKSLPKMTKELKKRGIDFKCRAYVDIPKIHGFLVNDEDLLLSLCDVQNGELVGAPNPYWRFEKDPSNVAAVHFFNAYSNWFEHFWKRSKKIWPL